ncbi:MAG TPA: aldehyde dehydrogenase family protein, partial [Acidimicrobiales bacterium]
MTRRIDHWIGGKLVPSTSGRSGLVYDPATGETQAEVGLASAAEVDDAVAAAADAFPAWRSASLSRRTEIMFRFRHLLDDRRAEVAAVLSSEHGKVRADAAGELARGIENVEFACGAP